MYKAMNHLTALLQRVVLLLSATTLLLVAAAELEGLREVHDNTEYVYQKPQASSFPTPKAVILLAHGCSHSATDWWPKSPTCEKCIGLPVETSITSQALDRGWLPVAVSSSNRQHKCWMPHDKGHAFGVVKHIIEHVLSIKDVGSIPVYALGASSGGHFVGMFGQNAHSVGINVHAINIQISSMYAQRIERPCPAVMFTIMERDKTTMQHVLSSVEEFKKHGIPCRMQTIHASNINPAYFLEHNKALIEADSEAFVAALKKAEYLDSDGKLIADPRQSDWRKVRTFSMETHTSTRRYYEYNFSFIFMYLLIIYLCI